MAWPGLAGLGDVTAKIGGYSRGMKQCLGVAQALINAPRLLLLDEPTSALDPIDELTARYGVRKVLIEFAEGADELAAEIRRWLWTVFPASDG